VQLAAVVSIAIATYFLVDVTRMAWRNYQLSQIVNASQTRIDGLTTEINRLQGVKTFVKTDKFAEMYARQMGLTKPGEVRIVMGPRSVNEDEIAKLLMPPEKQGPHRADTNWQAWHDLFFDSTE